MPRRKTANHSEPCTSEYTVPFVRIVVLSPFPARTDCDNPALPAHTGVKVRGDQIVVVRRIQHRQAPSDQCAELEAQSNVLRGSESLEPLDSLEPQVPKSPQRIYARVAPRCMPREQGIVGNARHWWCGRQERYVLFLG